MASINSVDTLRTTALQNSGAFAALFDASGRRVLNVSGANVTGSATPPKSKTLMWVAIAALVALVVFDS